jgi:hypothetical protein
MKTKLLKILLVSCCVLLNACQVDNFAPPDSQLFGGVLDEETNELIQQDVLEGSKIEYVQLNYSDNAPTRQIRFHSDGTYRDNNFFAGTYAVRALRGNFIPTKADTIKIAGATEFYFKSRPYIRIKNPVMVYDSIRGKVTATFSLDAVTSVSTIHLLCDPNPNVSWSIRNVTTTKNIGGSISSQTVYTLESSTTGLISGNDYYFRIAALPADVPEAKHNYSVPVKFKINNSNVIPEPPEKGKLLDGCESLNGWQSWGTLSLDAGSHEGSYAIKTSLIPEKNVIFQKVFSTPFDTGVSKVNGIFSFWLYISDASKFNWNIGTGESQIEITSSGTWDQQEIHWDVNKNMGLITGWNHLELKLADGVDDGKCNIKAINFVRFYHTKIIGAAEMKIDDLRFYE